MQDDPLKSGCPPPAGKSSMGRDLGWEFLREWVYGCFPDLHDFEMEARTGEGEGEGELILSVADDESGDWTAHYRLRHELYCEVFDWKRGDKGTQPSPEPLYLDAVAQLLSAVGLTREEQLSALDELGLVRSKKDDDRAPRRRLATGRGLRLKLEEATLRRGGALPPALVQLTDVQRRSLARQRRSARPHQAERAVDVVIGRLRPCVIPRSIAALVGQSPTAQRVILEGAAAAASG